MTRTAARLSRLRTAFAAWEHLQPWLQLCVQLPVGPPLCRRRPGNIAEAGRADEFRDLCQSRTP